MLSKEVGWKVRESIGMVVDHVTLGCKRERWEEEGVYHKWFNKRKYFRICSECKGEVIFTCSWERWKREGREIGKFEV